MSDMSDMSLCELSANEQTFDIKTADLQSNLKELAKLVASQEPHSPAVVVVQSKDQQSNPYATVPSSDDFVLWNYQPPGEFFQCMTESDTTVHSNGCHRIKRRHQDDHGHDRHDRHDRDHDRDHPYRPPRTGRPSHPRYCREFTRTGVCRYRNCRYIHYENDQELEQAKRSLEFTEQARENRTATHLHGPRDPVTVSEFLTVKKNTRN